MMRLQCGVCLLLVGKCSCGLVVGGCKFFWGADTSWEFGAGARARTWTGNDVLSGGRSGLSSLSEQRSALRTVKYRSRAEMR
jgi:hypothetical protein